MTQTEHAGDPAHPDHEQWLLALGRATYASQSLAGISVDVLRVHCGVDFWTLLPDSLGKLVTRLRREQHVPGLTAWLQELDAALPVRNDLAHAIPVKHGLHRRVSADKGRIVNFFDVEDLNAVTETLAAAYRTGNLLLYFDGGAAVSRL